MAGAGLFSCACILLCKRQPHPVTKGPGSFYFFSGCFFLLFSTLPPSHSSQRLTHICTGERTAVQRMHVGGRLESQVCPGAAAAAAAGVGGTVDGWRSNGRGPAGLLSGEADSKQTNTCTHRKKKRGILLTSISLSAATKTWESDGRVGEGGKKNIREPVRRHKRSEKSKREGLGTAARLRQVEPCWSFEGWVEWEGLV